MMIEKTQVVGPFQCNCRLLVSKETGDAVLIDPGDEADQVLDLLKTTENELGKKLNLKLLLHTHAHLDHIGATRSVVEALSKNQSSDLSQITLPKIALHSEDEPIYRALKMQGELFGMTYEDPLPVQHFLRDEEELKLGALKLTVIHTPGHSPGGVCFRLHEDSEEQVSETLYTGDTLFQGSIGRTDLWGGNTDQLLKSIRKRLLVLDGDTRICPGHGLDSKIGIEARSNPFLV